MPTLVRMRDKHGYTSFRAANLSYGNYDTTMTPSQTWIGGESFFLATKDIQFCTSLYAPDPATRALPDMSALYANLKDMPPALFTVGTLDAFLDDSLFVYARWIAAGNEAELAVYPGASTASTCSPIRWRRRQTPGSTPSSGNMFRLDQRAVSAAPQTLMTILPKCLAACWYR